MELPGQYSRRPMPRYDGDIFTQAYDDGYSAASQGQSENSNPHKPSGHERDSTIVDEQHYYWYLGWMDYKEG